MIRELQINPFTNEIMLQSLQEYNYITNIPSSPNYPSINSTMVIIFLDEIPYLLDRNNYPFVIEYEGNPMTEIETEPQAGEYRIAPFGSGRPNAIQFSIDDAGKQINIKYWGWGSVVTRETYVQEEKMQYIIKDIELGDNRTPAGTPIIGGKLYLSGGVINCDYIQYYGWSNGILIWYKALNVTANIWYSPQTGNASYDIFIGYKNNSYKLIFVYTNISNAYSILFDEGYTRLRRVGSFVTDIYGGIVPFTHYPEIKTFYFNDERRMENYEIPGSETLIYMLVPKRTIKPIFSVEAGDTIPGFNLDIYVRGANLNTVDPFVYHLKIWRDSNDHPYYKIYKAYIKELITNLDGELIFRKYGIYRGSANATNIYIHGYIDFEI